MKRGKLSVDTGISKAYDTVRKILLIERLKKFITANLFNQLRIFIAPVMAKVAGDITNTVVRMRRGLTQGGTSSPPLFKVIINDLLQALRDTIRQKFPQSVWEEPSLMVADDVIALAVGIEEMQAIADACCKWARENGFNWNPIKSQLIRILHNMHTREQLLTTNQPPTVTQARDEQNQAVNNMDSVTLDGTTVQSSEVADYLGMRVSNSGFVSRDINTLAKKGTEAIMIINREEWFSLKMHPKHISGIYDTYVRSTILYGNELLSHEHRKPLIEADETLQRLLFQRLLKLGTTRLAMKHLNRLRVVFRLPSELMEIDK